VKDIQVSRDLQFSMHLIFLSHQQIREIWNNLAQKLLKVLKQQQQHYHKSAFVTFLLDMLIN
jgi:hypothetical protein